MPLQKKDFIEIEFTGRVKDGEIFDSNILEDMKELHEGHSHEIEAKPIIFCLGEGMFLKGIDDFLIGKEVGNYQIELSPDRAFGARLAQLVQMVPIKVFQSQKLNPIPGSVFNFDGRIAKVLTVSGGRVIVDFNNPLAGKTVIYNIRVLKKVEVLNEKVKSFIDFLFRQELMFSIEGNKVILEVEKQMAEFVSMFKEKFKDVLGMEMEVRQKAEPLANSSESQIKEIEEKPKTPQ